MSQPSPVMDSFLQSPAHHPGSVLARWGLMSAQRAGGTVVYGRAEIIRYLTCTATLDNHSLWTGFFILNMGDKKREKGKRGSLVLPGFSPGVLAEGQGEQSSERHECESPAKVSQKVAHSSGRASNLALHAKCFGRSFVQIASHD